MSHRLSESMSKTGIIATLMIIIGCFGAASTLVYFLFQVNIYAGLVSMFVSLIALGFIIIDIDES